MAAPKGFDSVHAVGTTEPDPKQDKVIKIEGNEVVVPQGKPVNTGVQSSFFQSEVPVRDTLTHVRCSIWCTRSPRSACATSSSASLTGRQHRYNNNTVSTPHYNTSSDDLSISCVVASW